MTETEERVARALCETDMLEMLRTGMVADQCSPLEAALAAPGAIDKLWPNYVHAARAAIAAVCEPGDEVLMPRYVINDLLPFLRAKAAFPEREALIPIGAINALAALGGEG